MTTAAVGHSPRAFIEREEKAVCKRCHMVMDDCEPFSPSPEFVHKTVHRDGSKSKCVNAGKTLFLDTDSKEIEPFMRKRVRRAFKRAT